MTFIKFFLKYTSCLNNRPNKVSIIVAKEGERKEGKKKKKKEMKQVIKEILK